MELIISPKEIFREKENDYKGQVSIISLFWKTIFKRFQGLLLLIVRPNQFRIAGVTWFYVLRILGLRFHTVPSVSLNNIILLYNKISIQDIHGEPYCLTHCLVNMRSSLIECLFSFYFLNCPPHSPLSWEVFVCKALWWILSKKFHLHPFLICNLSDEGLFNLKKNSSKVLNN